MDAPMALWDIGRRILGELPPSTKPMERYGRVALAILVAIEIPE